MVDAERIWKAEFKCSLYQLCWWKNQVQVPYETKCGEFKKEKQNKTQNQNIVLIPFPFTPVSCSVSSTDCIREAGSCSKYSHCCRDRWVLVCQRKVMVSPLGNVGLQTVGLRPYRKRRGTNEGSSL